MAWCRHVLKSRDPKEFTAAVHRLALKSAWQEALQVLDDMENVHPPNMFVHNAVMDACKRGQQWAVAMQLFESLESSRWKESGAVARRGLFDGMEVHLSFSCFVKSV